jgi:signal transduction histidine kinase
MPGDFNQVILNMIVNAAHAISDVVGDGASGRGVITLSTRRVHDEAEIRISDTGCGMTPETAGRIFDPFFTTKAVGKGTGQGLAITHNVIVDKHGGTIKVESTPGTGTTFIIRLPLDIPMADAGSGTRAA